MRNKTFIPCALILCLSLLVRYLYSVYSPSIVIIPDSVDYWNFSQKIFSTGGALWIINPYRTSMYPIFIGLIRVLSHASSIYEAGLPIALVQSIIGLALLILVYKCSRIIGLSKNISLVLMLTIGINPLIFAWERVILTESLAISWLLLFTYQSIRVMQKPTPTAYATLLILSIVGYLLRPAFIMIPIAVFFGIGVIQRKKAKVVILTGSGLVFYVLTLLFFWEINNMNHLYNGLSRSPDYNLMEQILYYRLPVEQSRSVSPFFTDSITDFRKRNGFPMVYRFLESYDPGIYTNTARLAELSRFTRHVILTNLPLYLVKIVGDLPKAVTDVSVTIVGEPKTSKKFAPFFESLLMMYQYIQYFLYAFGIIGSIVVLKSAKYKSYALLIGIIILTQLTTNMLYGSGEFGRLLTPGLPIVYVFDVYILAAIFPKCLSFCLKRSLP